MISESLNKGAIDTFMDQLRELCSDPISNTRHARVHGMETDTYVFAVPSGRTLSVVIHYHGVRPPTMLVKYSLVSGRRVTRHHPVTSTDDLRNVYKRIFEFLDPYAHLIEQWSTHVSPVGPWSVPVARA